LQVSSSKDVKKHIEGRPQFALEILKVKEVPNHLIESWPDIVSQAKLECSHTPSGGPSSGSFVWVEHQVTSQTGATPVGGTINGARQLPFNGAAVAPPTLPHVAGNGGGVIEPSSKLSGSTPYRQSFISNSAIDSRLKILKGQFDRYSVVDPTANKKVTDETAYLFKHTVTLDLYTAALSIVNNAPDFADTGRIIAGLDQIHSAITIFLHSADIGYTTKESSKLK